MHSHEERIRELGRRYSQGLDLWTGKALKGYQAEERLYLSFHREARHLELAAKEGFPFADLNFPGLYLKGITFYRFYPDEHEQGTPLLVGLDKRKNVYLLYLDTPHG